MMNLTFRHFSFMIFIVISLHIIEEREQKKRKKIRNSLSTKNLITTGEKKKKETFDDTGEKKD